jgi:glycosyltransferase involved in cell wall biosynthesis
MLPTINSIKQKDKIMNSSCNGNLTKKVTWIIPVLNAAPYLEQCLESIYKQTYQDFEIIAWDNGSTDESTTILKKWIPDIIPGRIVTDQPLPLNECLSAMVEMSSTPLCARMDGDDICELNRLEKQVAFLEANPDVVAVGSQVRKLSADGVSKDIHFELPQTHEAIVLRLIRLWSMWHPSVIFHREAVIKAGNYSDKKPVEDYGLWMRLASIGRLANLPEPLLQYRIHDQSVTSNFIADGNIQELNFKCVTKHGDLLYGCNQNELSPLIKRQFPQGVFTILKIIVFLLRQPNTRKFNLLFEERWRYELILMVKSFKEPFFP